MANEQPEPPLKALLKSVDAATAEAYKNFRDAALKAGPLDAGTRELIQIAAFVPSRSEAAIKGHTQLALGLGVSQAAINQAVLITIGVTSTIVDALPALGWIDEVARSR